MNNSLRWCLDLNGMDQTGQIIDLTMLDPLHQAIEENRPYREEDPDLTGAESALRPAV
jgi:hypothetical protein